jgi:putative glycosyltransferase (TIGR04348 family)
MKIGIVTPAPPRSHYGNRVTAQRWARLLRQLGHRVTISQQYKGEPLDLLIAIHAKRSHPAVRRFCRAYPGKPLIVALAGTDLYRDFPRSRRAQESLELASRIVVLQPRALDELPPHLRQKARVIYQSSVCARAKSATGTPRARNVSRKRNDIEQRFPVCVVGHLRAVKDPFRAAMAARLLPASSRIQILQVGGAMTPAMAARAREEMKRNGRYRWLREQAPARVCRILQQSCACVLSSRMEGGANAISEAIRAGVPVLASRVPGNVGMLGKRYPGYFSFGATAELARLMNRFERDLHYRRRLQRCCERLAPLFVPERERAAWKTLLRDLKIW